MNLTNICREAELEEGSDELLRCKHTSSCEHQVILYNSKAYCRVPLNPDKHKVKFPKE